MPSSCGPISLLLLGEVEVAEGRWGTVGRGIEVRNGVIRAVVGKGVV